MLTRQSVDEICTSQDPVCACLGHMVLCFSSILKQNLHFMRVISQVGILISDRMLDMGKKLIHPVSLEPLVKWQSQLLFQNFVKKPPRRDQEGARLRQ
jgi:hypothetical protein